MNTIDNILNHLDKHNNVDLEHMHYFPEEHSFSSDEFKEFFDYLQDKYLNKHGHQIDGIFPEYRMYFNYDGRKFIWRMMCGQGTACQLLKEDSNWPEDSPMIYESSKEIVL